MTRRKSQNVGNFMEREAHSEIRLRDEGQRSIAIAQTIGFSCFEFLLHSKEVIIPLLVLLIIDY